MAGHPMHGVSPEARRVMLEAKWSGASGLYAFKLARQVGKRIEVHPTAGIFHGRAIIDGDKPVGPGAAAREWAARFPGWEIRFA